MNTYYLQLRTGLTFYSHNEFIFNEEGDLEPNDKVYDTEHSRQVYDLKLNRSDVIATWFETKKQYSYI